MLKVRILTAVVLACGLLLGIFGLPPRWAVLGFAVVFTAGAWEWAGFGLLRGAVARAAYTAGIALLMAGAWGWTQDPAHLMALLAAAGGWWLVAFLWLMLAPERHRHALTLVCGVPVLLPPFVALAHIQTAGHGFARGPEMVAWLLLLVSAADVGAYFAGRRFGRHKLLLRVSPGKTWEGALGGLALLELVSLIGALHYGLEPFACLAAGAVIGAASIVGDLTESMFKRAVGLKDSGRVLPGHGGLLDRIDSVTAAAPLYALGLFGAGVIA